MSTPTTKEQSSEVQELVAKKLDLFVRLREIHTEITKVNRDLAHAGADTEILMVCW